MDDVRTRATAVTRRLGALEGTRLELAGDALGAATALCGFVASHGEVDAATGEPLVSLGDWGMVRALVEFAAVAGCAVHFDAGCGVPIATRSQHIATVIAKLDDPPATPLADMDATLAALVPLRIEDQRVNQGKLTSRIFPDILAALFHVVAALRPGDGDGDSVLAALVQRRPGDAGTDSAMYARACAHLQTLASGTPINIFVGAVSGLFAGARRGRLGWLAQTCGNFMSWALLQPHGVQAILERTLSPLPEGDTVAFEKAVRVLAACPKQVASVDAYYRAICPQVRALMHVRGPNTRYLVRAAILLAGTLITQQPDLATEALLGEILRPLTEFRRVQQLERPPHELGEDGHEIELVAEGALGNCVEDMHRLLVGNAPTQPLLSALAPVISPLFQLYCFASRSFCNLKIACREVLGTFLKLSDHAVGTVMKIVLQSPVERDWHVAFAPGSTGGAVVRLQAARFRDYQWEAQCLVALIAEIKQSTIAGDLFVELLQEYVVASAQVDLDADRPLLLFQLILHMAETLGPAVLSNTPQLLSLLQALLKTATDPEVLSLSLGILAAVVAGEVPISKADRGLMLGLAPLLERLLKHDDPLIVEMASEARMRILTRDPAWAGAGAGPAHGSDDDDPDDPDDASLELVMQQLRDQLTPVRAHAVIQLRRLVLARHPKVVANAPKIVALLTSQLRDTDTYVYLSAVNGLAAMADVFPERVIPYLGDQMLSSQVPETLRLKFGEVLVRAAARCGEVLPRYVELFVRPLLRLQRDPSAEIRASSMSGLAELCAVLGPLADPYLDDILDCVHGIMTFDTDDGVRRGAMFVAWKTLERLGKSALHVLDPAALQKLYGLIKRVALGENDPVVQHHALEALTEMDALMEEFWGLRKAR